MTKPTPIEEWIAEKSLEWVAKDDGSLGHCPECYQEGAKNVAHYILEELGVMECLEFYAQGGNSNMDIWEHKELGYFTGKRAKALLTKLKGEPQ